MIYGKASHCMKTVRKSILLNHSPEQMYALVTDVEQYPAFLPWCDTSEVISETPTEMTAKVGMKLGGLHQSFTTKNLHEVGRAVHVQLVDGPFSHLEGSWQFKPLGELDTEGRAPACKVSFTMAYAFSSKTLAALVGPVFDKIASNLVDAFVARADAVYGKREGP